MELGERPVLVAEEPRGSYAVQLQARAQVVVLLDHLPQSAVESRDLRAGTDGLVVGHGQFGVRFRRPGDGQPDAQPGR